jgi:hypothetical protein
MTNWDHGGRGLCCRRGTDVDKPKLPVAGAEATTVRFTARSVEASNVDSGNCDVDGARSFRGTNKPACHQV